MIFTYSKMGKLGTRYMNILGSPTYLFALALIMFSPLNFFIKMLIATLAVLVFQYIYCKTLAIFNEPSGARFLTLWSVSVVLIQLCIFGLFILFAT